MPGQVIEQDSDFIFYWKSPGFRSGVKIEYRMIVAAIVPGVTISPEDAIDSGSSLVYYYDSGINDLDWEIIYGSEATWPVVETGISRELNVEHRVNYNIKHFIKKKFYTYIDVMKEYLRNKTYLKKIKQKNYSMVLAGIFILSLIILHNNN